MKKNIIPFAAIAVVGIFAIIIVSFVGVGQRNDIQEAEENGGENSAEENNDNGDENNNGEEGGDVADDPEAIFKQTCASCHGDDMTGGAGPDLTSVGSDHSEDEIHDIIMNGKGNMPAGLATEEEADALADWLSEMK